MHFTYIEPEGDLKQGDIIKRTPDIDAVLEDVHPHYFRKSENKYFIVLTQSCDLVRGRDFDPCKSRYISIAPVRTLDYILQREILSNQIADLAADLPVCTNRSRNSLHLFLERLFNNNESSYFYLHTEPTLGFVGAHCAILALPIALKAPDHYQSCLNARILGLNDNFQSKLGWLVGQMFSRVGTVDWEKAKLKQLIKSNLDEAAFWVDDKQLKNLRLSVKEWEKSNQGVSLDSDTLEVLISELKSRKEEVIERIELKLFNDKAIKELIDKSKLQTIFERQLAEAVKSVEEKQLEQLKSNVAKWLKENTDKTFTVDILEGLISELNDKKEDIFKKYDLAAINSKTIKEFVDNDVLNEKAKQKLKIKLDQDPQLTNLLR